MADAVGDEKNLIDRISSLPDEILLHIDSFLSPVSRIRTSLLSKRFQKISLSKPFLDCMDYPYKPKQFEKFMEKTLRNHELQRVRKFRLRCAGYTYKSATISMWINSAVTASVSNLQVLDIYVNHLIKPVKLPCSVFSCQKLKFLRLAGFIIAYEIPTGAFFPCLKILKLVSIYIAFKSVSIISGVLSNVFPVLEISHIEDCSLLKSSRIYETHPHLKYLSGFWVQGDCPNNLSKREPTFMVLKHLELQDKDMFEIVNFMGGNGNQPVFEHLTHLVVKVDQGKRLSALDYLLQNSPNLTSLELKKRYSRDIRNWEAPAATVYKCLSRNLETVQINEFYGSPEVEVVKYFLKNAKFLKNLVLCVARDLSDEIKASILNEPKASAQCKIEFLYPEELKK